MKPRTRLRTAAIAAIIAAPTLLLAPASAPAQLEPPPVVSSVANISTPPVRTPGRIVTRGSARGARSHSAAARRRFDPNALRIEVSIADRHLWAIQGADTLLSAPAAMAEGTSLKYAGRRWTFKTPRGVHTVLGKNTDPIWTPPDWHYAEVAQANQLKLAEMPAHKPVRLSNGTLLAVRDSLVGVIFPDSGNRFEALPVDEEIVFDNTLFIPPVGTKNRIFDGELGRFRLVLGDGYMIHGTPDESTLETAITHGCVRVRDQDLEWLFDNVPVGTPVVVR
ncbi:MAG TPA: L,D-transpeptidase [Gemmatimonadaceae bacterium]|nr:L,D-transpeptidase [Gemmatimonadaceae bacterium]